MLIEAAKVLGLDNPVIFPNGVLGVTEDFNGNKNLKVLSPADIAEMLKVKLYEELKLEEYITELEQLFMVDDSTDDITIWLILHCAPEQKIEAAMAALGGGE